MKKNILLITLIVLLGCFLFVSCDSEAAAPQTDELVKVAFVESTSKALTQNIPAFDVASHYWKYTAVKKDGSTLTTGATGTTHDVAQAKWVALDSNNSPKQGLSENSTPYQVINFSRGLWEFKLYGYSDAAGEKLVYTGTSNTVALTKDSHMVAVNVSRDNTSGAGTLVIDKDITINNASETAYTNLSSAVVRTYEIKKYDTASKQYEALDSSVTGTLGSEDVTIANLAAGNYQITITYADSTYTYGSGSANFVIYSNVTTTITGSVGEIITYAEFEAVATVINVTSSSRSFNSTSTESVEIKYENSTSDAVTAVSTTISNEVALALLATAIEEEGAVTEVTGKDVSNDMVLSLSVSTEESTATSATYNIDMNYTLTTTVFSNNTVESTTVYNGNTKTLSNYSTTPLNIGLKGLTNVNIDHDGLAMVAVNNLDTLNNITVDNTQGYTENTRSDAGDTFYAGFMFYDSNAGIVYLRTRSYSPFTLTYEVPKYVASIGTTFYTTLEAAFDAASDGDTIVLLDDITQDNGYKFDKTGMTITLDTNRKTITVNSGSNINNRAFRIDNGTLIVNGRGSIVAVGSGTNASNGYGCYGAFRVESEGTLIASDLTLTNARPWGLNVKVCGGTATLTNVSITSSYGGGIEVTEANLGTHSKAGTATLNNCMFSQTGYYDHCSTPLSVSGGSELIVNGGTYTSANHVLYVFSSGGVITVNNGTFNKTAENDHAGIVAAIDTNTYPQYIGGLIINDGNFTCNYDITYPAYISIIGGTFNNNNPSAYVAEGYAATKVGNVWTVSPAVSFIVRGEEKIYFSSIQDAFNGALNGETVQLMADLGTEEIPFEYASDYFLFVGTGDKATGLGTSSKNITLDLNGHLVYGKSTFTGNNGLIYIYNGSELTVKDSCSNGALKFLDGQDNTGGYVIKSYGKLTIDGGTIENKTLCQYAALQAALDIGPNQWGGTYNPETVTLIVNNGVIKSNGDNTIRLTSFSSGSSSTNVYAEINGGTVIGLDGFFIQYPSSDSNFDVTLVVRNGDLSQTTQSIRFLGFGLTNANASEDKPVKVIFDPSFDKTDKYKTNTEKKYDGEILKADDFDGVRVQNYDFDHNNNITFDVLKSYISVSTQEVTGEMGGESTTEQEQMWG